MTDLKIDYMGLSLAHPLMPGASPLGDNLDTVRRLEDAGAAAIVTHSLFEEQIMEDIAFGLMHRCCCEESFIETRSYLPKPDDYVLSPDEYLEHVRRIKEAVSIPVIASLNGSNPGSWIDYSALIEEAGADALELNIYHLPTNPADSGAAVEQRVLNVVRSVHDLISIPLAVKLSPHFSSPCNLASEIAAIGVNGIVLFNRPYQPDIDIEELQAVPRVGLSSSEELGLRLRWLAILHANVDLSLAVTGGVHTVEDVIKGLMAGASGVQIVSALLSRGPDYLRVLLEQLQNWMEEHGYRSATQMIGSMSLRTCPNREVFERANYLRTLQIWRR